MAKKMSKITCRIANREAGNRVINVFRIIIFEPRRQKLISWLITSRWKPLSGSNLLITGNYWYNISAHLPPLALSPLLLAAIVWLTSVLQPNGMNPTLKRTLWGKVELSKTLEIRIRSKVLQSISKYRGKDNPNSNSRFDNRTSNTYYQYLC